MQRSSQAEHDYVVLSTAAVQLGTRGLDLREPADPGALTKLLNARFRDDKTVERRLGHRGVLVQDGGLFPPTGDIATDGWVYGHGLQLADGVGYPGLHHPVAGRCAGVFRYGESDVVWTGDRLLVMREGETAQGEHAIWGRGNGSQPHGIPAYLPVQTDSAPPDVVSGDYVETLLTEDLRVIAATTADNELVAWVVSRSTGAIVDRSVVDSGTITHLRLGEAGQPALLWLRGSDLMISWWGGIRWSTPSRIAFDVLHYDVAATSNGFGVGWQPFGGGVLVGRYHNRKADNSVLSFGTNIEAEGVGIPLGPFALAFAPDDSVAVAFQSDLSAKLCTVVTSPSGADGRGLIIDDTAGPWSGGVAVCFRELAGADGLHPLVVHAGTGSFARVYEIGQKVVVTQGEGSGVGISTELVLKHTETRYRSQLASKSWRVGDEVFCWFRALNASTCYLVAGSEGLQVCGYCDREEAKERVVNNDMRSLPAVTRDPRGEYLFTWIRPYAVLEDYARAGNVRVGDMNFMPRLSAVQYGESMYLAGCNVRNYDGVELGDAGFHDYPLVESVTQSTGGSLTTDGSYQWRVYPVRYNRQGERFMGAALTTATTVLTGSNNKATLDIYTVPDTNHDDVVLEVYRTESLGTTFYFEGVVANSRDSETVQFESTMADGVLRLRPADPHETGVASADELEEFGPLGCEILTVAGDRLWGAGGQVPAGMVQYSKLKEPVEGAGFDVFGTHTVDSEGGRITSLSPLGDGLVIFMRDRIYLMFGTGPNNLGAGAFSTPQIKLVDGAITHWGTVDTPLGLMYWGVGGPRLLTIGLEVENISLPVRRLTERLDPSGVQINRARGEVVWFTERGDAVLLNYVGRGARWAQWDGLRVAGCSKSALAMADGRVFREDEDAYGDDGRPFEFAGATGPLQPEGILAGATELHRVGVVGEYHGPHRLRMRVYYNGSPTWSEQQVWAPSEDTWLVSGEELYALTPAQIDALGARDQSGAYVTHKKVRRHNCRSFRVEWSDISSDRPTYTPHQLALELGSRGGLGRIPASTFTRS